MDGERLVGLVIVLTIGDGHSRRCEGGQLGVAQAQCVGVVGDFMRRHRFAEAAIEEGYRSGDLVLWVFETGDERVNSLGSMLSGEILYVGHDARSAVGIA
jgi:hypothetical protein